MAEDARERILDACAGVIARSGLRRFRMTDVAREAGVSIGLLAYHFGDRDGLLAAALDHVTAGTNERAALNAAPESEESALRRLELLLCSEFGDEPGVREGSTAWNEVRAAAVFESAQAAAVARSTADWQRQVEELLVAAAHGEGSTPGRSGIDAAALARVLTALVEGLSGRWLTGQLTASEAQESIRIALRGLGIGAGAAVPGSG